jgi:hypothetical protein
MTEYHRGFEDALALVNAAADKWLSGSRPNAREFVKELHGFGTAVRAHKVTELQGQMGL